MTNNVQRQPPNHLLNQPLKLIIQTAPNKIKKKDETSHHVLKRRNHKRNKLQSE